MLVLLCHVSHILTYKLLCPLFYVMAQVRFMQIARCCVTCVYIMVALYNVLSFVIACWLLHAT